VFQSVCVLYKSWFCVCLYHTYSCLIIYFLRQYEHAGMKITRNPWSLKGASVRHVVVAYFRKCLWLFYLCAFLLGISFISMLRCMIDDNVTISVATSRGDPKLESCRIAVTNSVATHYETLESIAALLPLKYFNLSNTTCDNTSLVFDYHILGDEDRVQSWVYYFHVGMAGKSFVTDDNNTQRMIGQLHVYEIINNKRGVIEPGDGYDAVIEASCYCRGGPVNHVRWMKANPHRSCIFHEKCSKVADYPTAVCGLVRIISTITYRHSCRCKRSDRKRSATPRSTSNINCASWEEQVGEIGGCYNLIWNKSNRIFVFDFTYWATVIIRTNWKLMKTLL